MSTNLDRRLSRLEGRIHALKHASTFEVREIANHAFEELLHVLQDARDEIKSLNQYADISGKDIESLATRLKNLEAKS